jgi:hypothetical protein
MIEIAPSQADTLPQSSFTAATVRLSGKSWYRQ